MDLLKQDLELNLQKNYLEFMELLSSMLARLLVRSPLILHSLMICKPYKAPISIKNETSVATIEILSVYITKMLLLNTFMGHDQLEKTVKI